MQELLPVGLQSLLGEQTVCSGTPAAAELLPIKWLNASLCPADACKKPLRRVGLSLHLGSVGISSLVP